MERFKTAGQQLVGVSLVPDIPDDLVLRGIEHPVQSDRQFDHAKRARQMAAVGGDNIDDLGADFVTDSVKLVETHRFQLSGRLQSGEQFTCLVLFGAHEVLSMMYFII